eukprot:CAMPEP_0197286356 /NCGR_PEP_ID=MMETSP0890-20130614/1784_1 /TAXON_ID=44058 ORGANISM="Aureoumbra lagunensis, Strain CCMP1510" /NCGR_SAMPLE_ID=MMETSP0890 /ASSEMBLY_ACC=CAM_ASM_000533 /LENGTH=768 /DNA_ID=CAMNT_0042754623 /DNA_START=167 /DNA_END=2473 /DNA_ORIENTATION=-
MPKISPTERVALGCGTVGFDRELFSGKPGSVKDLMETYGNKMKLTEEEIEFLKVETETLCSMVDDHAILENKDFSEEVWHFMRRAGFMGLKIPKEWGGKGFSTAATSAILVKLGSVSSDLTSTVAVPNSLGPGELLVKYGTQEQKEYYLPLLADGTLIPCFGLTGVHSGSDATSLIGSYGIVEKDTESGELGVRCQFDKRYITLAPVAGLVGIGFDLRDPQNLLKGKGEEGFSVALLERDHPGLEMGPRHQPLSAAFMNGTIKGNNVWIPLTKILGGQERCGFGWHMFVECLAEGRGVSLPAMAVAVGKGLGPAVGSYARARKQFKVPIAEFGGIQEALATIASDGYISLASTQLMNAVVDNHEAPMILSSIMKQNITERGRTMINKGMDIMGGAAISMGPNNIAGNPYMSMPIAITVEGANIMTRSFQIIGQGLMRCHPHLLQVVEALEANDDKAPSRFMLGVQSMIRHALSTLGRSMFLGIKESLSSLFSFGHLRKLGDSPQNSADAFIHYHEQRLSRLAANFAFAADMALLLGGRLKFEEMFMGRLADALGATFLGYATLTHYAKHHATADAGLRLVADHALLRLEKEAHEALRHAAANVPPMLLRFDFVASALIRMAIRPIGSLGTPDRAPTDAHTKQVADLLTTNASNYASTFLLDGSVYVSDGIRKTLLDALPICLEADALTLKLRKENREPTSQEVELLNKAEAMRDAIVQVSSFEKLGFLENQPGYVRPAIKQTEQWLEELGQADKASSAASKVSAAASA